MSGSTSAGSNATTGTFYTTNGQIIGPNGVPFVARGIDVMEGNQPSASTLQSDFPGINFVRLAIYDYASPTTLAAYVNQLTAAGIVVELEDHTNSTGSNAGGSSGTIFTGSQLTTELNWYSSIATAFKNNPYVWFGTDNEPSEVDASGNEDPAALSTWQQQTYNAVRDTGNTSPIMVEMNGGASPSTFGQGYTASDYASMNNIIWDVHYYGWVTGYSTDQSTVSANLAADIAQAQQITSANGTVPVLIGEYGNSTTGQGIDPNGDQVISAVQQSGYGSAAWAWSDGGPGDGLTTNGGSGLSAYGQQIAAGIAAAAAAASTTPITTAAPSATDTILAAGATGSIIDASHNTWTIVNGAVDRNGTAAGYSANVAEIAYVGGTIWQENTSNLWWSWTGTGWSTSSSSSSPLPATPTPTPSANDTTLAAGATGSIIDASHNTWTIVNSAVDENGAAAGYSASVAEIAYVGGTIWQENTSNLWWSWTGTAWSAGSGTATSPLPAIPTPSANDTTLMAGATGSIIDASHNAWTIVSGAVDENGAAAGYSASVAEIAYVGGTVWQENTSHMWWSWTGTAWSAGSGTSTSPLPVKVTPDTIKVTAAGVSQAVTNSGTVDGDIFSLASSGVVQATLGATATTLSFVGSTGVTVIGGSAAATVTATAGTNSFTAGSGALNVTGGSGADAYVFHTGSGVLTVKDFSVSKGDSLTVDSSLKTSMTDHVNHAGDMVISFGGKTAIDLHSTATMPAIHWA